MLSRRNLRIKVMQTLFAYRQNSDVPLSTVENNLQQSIDYSYQLYLYNLYFIGKVGNAVEAEADRRAAKHIQTDEDKSFSRKFFKNPIIQFLINDEAFNKRIKREKLQHKLDTDVVKLIYKELKTTNEYQEYLQNPERQFVAERKTAVHLYRDVMLNNEAYDDHMEDIIPTWPDDWGAVTSLVVETLRRIPPFEGKEGIFTPSGIASRETLNFGKELLKFTNIHEEYFQKLIAEKLENWEMERTSMLDKLLMEMAVCEMIHFPTIPTKVSINEYIEISKQYSTPKSKDFINGVLDRTMKQLKEEGKIHKTGRGLVGE